MSVVLFSFANRPPKDLWKDKDFTRAACGYLSACGGAGTTPTLDQVLGTGNLSAHPIVIGPNTATNTSGYAAYLGESIQLGDGSGDLRLRDLLDGGGLFHSGVHANAGTNSANIHITWGPSNLNNSDGLFLSASNGVSFCEVINAAGAFTKATPTTFVFNPVSGGLSTIQQGTITSNRTYTLPDYNGVFVIPTPNRVTGQIAANVSFGFINTPLTVDASFRVTVNLNITTSTTYAFTVVCVYTDETNTARTQTLNFSNLAGVIATSIANAGGAIPYTSIPIYIRCKASTSITMAAIGTFTSVVYNAEAVFEQLS